MLGRFLHSRAHPGVPFGVPATVRGVVEQRVDERHHYGEGIIETLLGAQE